MKGKILPREIKNYVINRPNETIYIGFSKLPTPFQKRAFIGFLYQAKKEILNLKEYKKKFIKPDMIDAYWEDYLKKNMPIFEIDLDLFLKIINYGKNNKKELIDILNDIKNIRVMQIKIKKEKEENLFNYRYDFDYVDLPEEEIEKIDEVVISNMITYIKVNFETKKVYFALSPEINQYLYYSKDYTRMNIFVPSFINSSYAIELYEILLDKFNALRGLMEKKQKENSEIIETGWIELEVFYRKMAIDEDGILREFKYFNRELKRWVEKLNKTDLVEFEIVGYEKKRTGRKISHLKFYLKPRDLLIKEEEKEEKFVDFRQKLLQKAKELGGELYIEFDNDIFMLKSGYLFKDGKILSKEEALEIWELLYKNKNRLILKSFEDLVREQEQKKNDIKNLYDKINELKQKYKRVLITTKKGKKIDCVISDIVLEDEKIKIFLLADIPLAPLVFENIEKAEEFLKNSSK